MTKPPDPKLSEAGRKGGIASGEARRKRRDRGFLDAARALVRSDPERLVEQLASSPAGAVKLVAILERQGILEPEPKSEPGPTPARVNDREPVSLSEVIAFAREIGVADRLGLSELGLEVKAEEADGAGTPLDAPLHSATGVSTAKAPPSTELESQEATIQTPKKPKPAPKPTPPPSLDAQIRKWREARRLPTGKDVYGDAPLPPRDPYAHLDKHV